MSVGLLFLLVFITLTPLALGDVDNEVSSSAQLDILVIGHLSGSEVVELRGVASFADGYQDVENCQDEFFLGGFLAREGIGQDGFVHLEVVLNRTEFENFRSPNDMISLCLRRQIGTFKLIHLDLVRVTRTFSTTHWFKEILERKARSPFDNDPKRQSPIYDDEGVSEHNFNTTSKIVAIQLMDISKDASYTDQGRITALSGGEVNLHVYGFGLTNDSEIKLSSFPAPAGQICKSNILHVQTRSFPMMANSEGTMANVTIPAGTLPILDGEEVMYVCLRAGKTGYFFHQGTAKSLQIEVYELLLPVWLISIFIIILLTMSGLFSGLNLGLMALDQTELKIIQNTGSEKEKRHADTILPVRAHGNLLLCTLLLGNVLVNNTLTILLDTLTSGIIAVIGATLAIVIMGEIVPQALCSRHALAVGANTIWVTKFFMLLTFPLAYPISKVLDLILGEEMGTVYDKKRLIELLKVTREKNDLIKEEVDIVTGALIYKEKTVRSVMTPISDCYLLSFKAVLNFETMSEIRDQGYSRIPVYDGDRSNIIYVLLVKDLMFIDPDDNTPLATVCEFYKNEANFVYHDTTLNVMLNVFKSGEKGHMAFVQEAVTCDDTTDPTYETIGLVTLEDIIEEIIQQEIVDETDVITDNKTKKRRKRKFRKPSDQSFPLFQPDPAKLSVSPQVMLAVLQYVTTTVEPFKLPYMSSMVVKKLLAMDVFFELKLKRESDDEVDIVQKGKPMDFFMLIVEGRVQAKIGSEGLIFESGPFSYYGLQVLKPIMDAFDTDHATTNNNPEKNLKSVSSEPQICPETQSPTTTVPATPTATTKASVCLTTNFVPDYSLKPLTDILYLKIKKTTYQRALMASKMKRPLQEDQDFTGYFQVEEEPIAGNRFARSIQSEPTTLTPSELFIRSSDFLRSQVASSETIEEDCELPPHNLHFRGHKAKL